MILSVTQASAIADAMSALNNVNGHLNASIGLVTVEEVGGRWIIIIDHSSGKREEYDGQWRFLEAYNI